MWLEPRLTSEPCACQPLLASIVKELFYIEFAFPIWAAPPLSIGGSVSFTAGFGVSLGGRACIADRAQGRNGADTRGNALGACVRSVYDGCQRACGASVTSPVAMPLACQVAASVFLDLTIIRGGIEMEIELVTIGVQPVGIVSLKDGASMWLL